MGTVEKWSAKLDNITIPCTYSPVGFGKVLKTELHHSLHASLKGYGQCSYLRFQNEDGDAHCTPVVGKSRISPSKVITVPRLDSTAAVFSGKMSKMLKEELGAAVTEGFFWTDSKVVFGYTKMKHGDSTPLWLTAFRRFTSAQSLNNEDMFHFWGAELKWIEWMWFYVADHIYRSLKNTFKLWVEHFIHKRFWKSSCDPPPRSPPETAA